MNFKSIAAACAVATIAATSAPADAGSRSTVRIINNSSETVLSIVSAPTYRSRYGSTDLLGSHTLSPGYNISVDFNTDDAENECTQDVKAIGTNGVKWTRRLNVCRISTWTLGD